MWSSAAVCLAALFALTWHGAVCLAEEIAPAASAAQPATEVLVLHDGGVLIGKITRAGDRYVVNRGAGEIQVPASRVLIAGNSLEDAYEYRRTQIARPSADAYLSLAEWCLRYGLLPQAARELLDARGLEPLHPRLNLLERRLMAASSPPRRADRHVMPAAHLEPAPATGGAAISNRPRADELPRGAVERFTRRVQPILVNNCTISGCHQPGGKQDFQLDRALLHGLANRRSTMKNLSATLALIDLNQSQQSPLLTVPRQSHGGMQAPIFGPRQQGAFKHLEDWVALVTESAAAVDAILPAAAESENATTPVVTQPAPVSTSNVEPNSSVTNALYGDDGEFEPPGTEQLRYGAQLHAWQPRDPFDPEIFNRRQRRRAQAAVSKANAAKEN